MIVFYDNGILTFCDYRIVPNSFHNFDYLIIGLLDFVVTINYTRQLSFSKNVVSVTVIGIVEKSLDLKS